MGYRTVTATASVLYRITLQVLVRFTNCSPGFMTVCIWFWPVYDFSDQLLLSINIPVFIDDIKHKIKDSVIVEINWRFQAHCLKLWNTCFVNRHSILFILVLHQRRCYVIDVDDTAELYSDIVHKKIIQYLSSIRRIFYSFRRTLECRFFIVFKV